MILKVKGGGCQTLVYGGEPMCYHRCLICHLPLSHPTSSMFVELVEGSYCLRKCGHGEALAWKAAVSSNGTHAQWQKPSFFLTHGRFTFTLGLHLHGCGLWSVHSSRMSVHPCTHKRSYSSSRRERRSVSPHAPVVVLLLWFCACSEQVEWPQGPDFYWYVS